MDRETPDGAHQESIATPADDDHGISAINSAHLPGYVSQEKHTEDGEPRQEAQAEPEHSVFSSALRRYIITTASFAGFFSPLSANIYLPALNSLANDLSVSSSMINLTVTSYMIFQGLAPMFIGDFADTTGRRPAYIVCFTIYIAANIGLALQHDYVALLLLRCLQSTGSSTTIALASGVVADIATTAQRGSYVGFVTAGSLLGPSLGPVIGGLLAQYLGWRAIFWFLVILAAVFMSQFVLFYPETARNIVGNGSIPPPKWNMSLVSYWAGRKSGQEVCTEGLSMKTKWRIPNPLKAIGIALEKDTGMVLLSNGIINSGFYVISSSMPRMLHEIYGFNDSQIGLCYLPLGAGSAVASVVNGYALDYNYRRIAKELSLPVVRNKQQDLLNFPIEKARLQLTFPLLLVACCSEAAFGWSLHAEAKIAAPLVISFIAGLTLTGAFNTVSTLIIDVHPTSAATATAANNLVRCLIGAGATALILPMIDALGRGWCFTLIGFLMGATTPMLLVVIHFGPRWRKARYERKQVSSQAAGEGSSRSKREGER